MPSVARKDDTTLCPEMVVIPVYSMVPSPPVVFAHDGGPLFNVMPVCLEVNGKPVIRLGDEATCKAPAPLDVVFEGAATFTVCGLPVARVGDHMVHTGSIVVGSPTVEVGGPTFMLPANITVVGPTDFQNKVIRDLYLISTAPSGKDLLDQLGALGQPMRIEPESDPHNSFCAPDVMPWSSAHQDGTGAGSIVKYNPEIAVYMYDDKGAHIPGEPQTVLAHEMVHGLNNAKGTNRPGNEDPASGLGPASQPDIEIEEEQTIGTGQFNGNSPTENSIRADLGLPRRDNHFGDTGVVGRPDMEVDLLFFKMKVPVPPDRTHELTTPTANLRPGDC
jgi:uncharacterized Zn-binding protein involved in type VI secretion